MPTPIPLVAARRQQQRQAARARWPWLRAPDLLLEGQVARYPTALPPCERLVFLDEARTEVAALLAQARRELVALVRHTPSPAGRAPLAAVRVSYQALQQRVAAVHTPLQAALAVAWAKAAQRGAPEVDLAGRLGAAGPADVEERPGAPVAAAPKRRRRGERLLALAEAVAEAAEVLELAHSMLTALLRLKRPPAPRPALEAVLAGYQELAQLFATVHAPLVAELDAARAAADRRIEEATLVARWLECLPVSEQGHDPCEGYWGYVDGYCAAPTTYVLYGRYTEDLRPMNAWYYCTQHAQELAAHAGLAWPP